MDNNVDNDRAEYLNPGSDQATDDDKIFSDESSESEPVRKVPSKPNKPQARRGFAEAEANPDLYGLRRSGRARAAPTRLNIGSGSANGTSDSDDSGSFQARKKKTAGKGRLRSKAIIRRTKVEQSSETDSGSDFEGVRRKRRPRKSDWEDDFPRYSTRQRNPALNYDEEEDETDLEEDSLDATGFADDAETAITIDGFYDERTEEDGQSAYLIKWVGKSFRQLEWVALKDLESLKGFKKLLKFQEARREFAQALANPNLPDDERERLLMEDNERKDILEEHKKVDRVIAKRMDSPSEANPGGIAYLVKWCGIGYEAATWETADALTADQDAIDKFLQRSNANTVSSLDKPKSATNRGEYKPFRGTDFLSGGQLREFQELGVNWSAELWHKDKNGILADEMGLGKTVQTVALLAYLFHRRKVYGPHLVAVPLGTITAWQREFAKWAPSMNVITYQGNRQGRQMIRDHEFYRESSTKTYVAFNVLLTTYEMITQDKQFLSQFRWEMLAVDEAHRLKNEASRLHQTLAKEYSTANRFLITGTPLQNNVQELLALVKFLSPDANVDTNISIDLATVGEGGETNRKVRMLQDTLRPITLRRMKKDVETSLPGKTEKMLRIPMTDSQRALYQAIYTKNLADVKTESQVGQISLQNIVMQLKKASNSTWLFPNCRISPDSPKDDLFRELLRSSGKMQILDQLMTRFLKNGNRVLIFSQMVNMLDLLADYLNYRGMTFQRLDGTIPSEARKRAMDHFNAPGSTDFAFLLSTRAGGLGLNLETADTVILFDQDWNPQTDLQAIARAHRIGQKKSVQVFRFITADSVEEEIVERAKRKMVLEYAIMHEMPGDKTQVQASTADLKSDLTKDLATILKFGAKKLFSEKIENGSEGDAHEKKVDLDEILAKAENTEVAQPDLGLGASQEFMNRWTTLDIEMKQSSFESIIPANDELRAQADALLKDVPSVDVPPPSVKKPMRPSYAELDDEDDEVKPRKGGKTKARKNGSDAKTFNRKEVTDLANALMTWGHLELKFAEIVTAAGLEEKEPSAVRDIAKALTQKCQEAVDEVDRELEMAGRHATKAEKEKAVFIDFKDTRDINARKVLERLPLMQALVLDLDTYIKRHKSDLSYRIPDVEVGTTARWHSEPKWNVVDDSMMLIGMHRHGFGNWRAIQDDPELGLAKKFHLGGERSSDQKDKLLPKKLHLDRRAIYLLKEIKNRDAHRSSPTGKRRRERDGSGVGDIEVRKSSKARQREKDWESRKPGRKLTPDENKREKNAKAGADRATEEERLFVNYKSNLAKLKKVFQPYREHTDKLTVAHPHFDDKSDKGLYIYKLIENHVVPVARGFTHLIAAKKTEEDRSRVEAQLFRYFAETYCDDLDGTRLHWRQLRDLYRNCEEKHANTSTKSPTAVSPAKRAQVDDGGGPPAKLQRRSSSQTRPPRSSKAGPSSSEHPRSGAQKGPASNFASKKRTFEEGPGLSGQDAPRSAKRTGGILDDLAGYKIPKKADPVEPVVVIKERSPVRPPAKTTYESRRRERSRSMSPDRRRSREYERSRGRDHDGDYERERDRHRDSRDDRSRPRGRDYERERERRRDRSRSYDRRDRDRAYRR
ncbi:hypothetical protein HDU87_001842 [Geranomyces variabilis]|uniref:Uncharacterized protein n=1 Tax=Geranomyces variabilis TaxID=109894 RepID=A0AAD5TM66_9FUNG|nr:hypothetical protein HDU87_001842 [Geranomyces variabilis]